MIKALITVLITLAALRLHAQEIMGTISDEKREPVMNASIMAYQGGTLKGSTVTDFDGKYVVKPLDTGIYYVLFTYPGYDSVLITDIPVKKGSIIINAGLTRYIEMRKCTLIKYRNPLISKPTGR